MKKTRNLNLNSQSFLPKLYIYQVLIKSFIHNNDYKSKKEEEKKFPGNYKIYYHRLKARTIKKI